jgi:hypothetical protein
MRSIGWCESRLVTRLGPKWFFFFVHCYEHRDRYTDRNDKIILDFVTKYELKNLFIYFKRMFEVFPTSKYETINFSEAIQDQWAFILSRIKSRRFQA